MNSGYRWYDHPIMRPFTLAYHVLFRKHWHPQRQRLARMRALYWRLLRRWDSEICACCGRPVRIVFHVPNYLWYAHSGFPDGAGILCVACFDDLAGWPLHWTCSRSNAVMRDPETVS